MIGPTGCTTNVSAHRGLYPRTWLVGRRARSRNAIVVMTNSADAPTTIAVCCRREKSDHRFLSRVALFATASVARSESPFMLPPNVDAPTVQVHTDRPDEVVAAGTHLVAVH